MRKVAIGCDPNGKALINVIKILLTDLTIDIDDYGSDDPIYANTAIEVAEAVAHGEYERGILMCGTGLGMCIAANKVYGAYAAMCPNVYLAERSRESCNVNILTLGAWVLGPELAKNIVTAWLGTQYTPGGRSEPKIQWIYEYEQEHQR